MTLKQHELFGGVTEVSVNYVSEPQNLPKPANDWALAIYILLNSPKGVTVLDANGKWGMIKFQERLNEVLKNHPELATKKRVTVRKRLGRKVDVMLYSADDKPKAVEVYFKINQKNGSKILNQ